MGWPYDCCNASEYDGVIRWKPFPRYWPFVRVIHRSSVDSPHEGQWRGALMFSLICTRANGWANNRDTGDLRRHRAHYDVTVMSDPEEYVRIAGTDTQGTHLPLGDHNQQRITKAFVYFMGYIVRDLIYRDSYWPWLHAYGLIKLTIGILAISLMYGLHANELHWLMHNDRWTDIWFRKFVPFDPHLIS